MRNVHSLLDLQREFLATVYDEAGTDVADVVVDEGLAPAVRVRIYRNSGVLVHTEALRTSYPAVLALVGEAFFEQSAIAYRAKYPSRSGNLQAFGARFGDFLESLPATQGLPYLGDVARLEWLRQQVALASDAGALTPAEVGRALRAVRGGARIGLHPSVRCLASAHPALTLWRYAMQPTAERLTLSAEDEFVLLWRSDGEVAMASVDSASFAFIESLTRGFALGAAHATACGQDPDFDPVACIVDMAYQGLIAAVTGSKENAACPDCSG
ncbi:MAG: putative DNA-binding domain-containing protein [Proteobacteria bacterium]|nr:putative DNA-binding domain-containing protein [Pseudomonadota bacterium]MBS0462206.1 putative DNA-binding domain-containing protein [Pseudomonadota bacterium]